MRRRSSRSHQQQASSRISSSRTQQQWQQLQRSSARVRLAAAEAGGGRLAAAEQNSSTAVQAVALCSKNGYELVRRLIVSSERQHCSAASSHLVLCAASGFDLFHDSSTITATSAAPARPVERCPCCPTVLRWPLCRLTPTLSMDEGSMTRKAEEVVEAVRGWRQRVVRALQR